MTLVVRAGSFEKLAHEQGRATARSHASVLTEDVALLEGRTGTAWDELARRTLLVETAVRATQAMDAESRAFFAAYADGVNDARPEDRPWQPWTPAGIFVLHHVLFGTFGHQLWHRHVRRTLGTDALADLAQEAPAMSGSNAWVVGGERTASGSPLIGADPHRVLSWPGVYQRVHLVAEGVDVLGLTFPGVPGVQHFGHTGSVAWAVTNAMAETQDAIDVDVRCVDGETSVRRQGASAWHACSVHDGVVRSPWGPLVVGRVPAEGERCEGVVLRWTVHALGDLGLSAVLPLLRARRVSDVEAALDHWVEPVNDVLVADREGVVMHRLAGRVPRRGADGEWDGWLDVPTVRAGREALVVSANHRRPGRELVAREVAPPHRADRLEQLLDGRDDLDVDDAVAVHADTLLLPAVAWQKRLADQVTSEVAVEERRALLLGWDARMDTSSLGAGAFADLRSTLVRRLAAHPSLLPLRAEHGLDPVWEPWLQPEPRIALALDRWVEAGSAPRGIDLDVELAAALVESATRPARAWGETHGVDVPDVGRVPLAGDDGCVLSTASVPGLDDTAWRGPVARVVWDLADRSASRWTVPDEVEVWAAGGMGPLPGGDLT